MAGPGRAAAREWTSGSLVSNADMKKLVGRVTRILSLCSRAIVLENHEQWTGRTIEHDCCDRRRHDTEQEAGEEFQTLPSVVGLTSSVSG